jgi:hypothetical protein
MLRTAIYGAIVTLSGCGVSLAQDFVPPKPGPEHARLKEFVGTWDAVFDMAGQKTKATATYKSICSGMWLASDFEGELAGMPFQGHGIDGYDAASKKYVGVWCDSMSGTPMNFTGTYDEKTKLVVMTGEHPGPDGKPQKFKNTTEHKDKDHFTFKMYMVQPDGAEQLAFTIEYTRRK